jgi:transposase
MIRLDAACLPSAHLDMRAGTDSALTRAVGVFGVAHPHYVCLFINKRANRTKVLGHEGIGIWLAARRPHQGNFVWPAPGTANVGLACAQLDALVLALPVVTADIRMTDRVVSSCVKQFTGFASRSATLVWTFWASCANNFLCARCFQSLTGVG